jgi:hypothetical protein
MIAAIPSWVGPYGGLCTLLGVAVGVRLGRRLGR